jgi:hypothetical protein
MATTLLNRHKTWCNYENAYFCTKGRHWIEKPKAYYAANGRIYCSDMRHRGYQLRMRSRTCPSAKAYADARRIDV